MAGGALFGILMAMMSMLPMVGMLSGQENAIVGFIVHMVISAGIGASYGLIASRLPQSWGVLFAGGAIYGVIRWVLGALLRHAADSHFPCSVFKRLPITTTE